MSAKDRGSAPGAWSTSKEERAFFASYDPAAYPSVAVTVDVVVLTLRHGGLNVLLVPRSEPPYQGAWALPGWFIGPGEDADAAAVRGLGAETGLDARSWHVEQLRTFTDPNRDPRMRVVSVAYLALVPNLAAPASGTGGARFWPIENGKVGAASPLAFDHGDILDVGVERARAKLEYTTLAASFLGEPFTIPELRGVYEAVWGTSLEPANFRRKVLKAAGFLRPTGDKAPPVPGRGRPKAELFAPGPATQLSPPFLRSNSAS